MGAFAAARPAWAYDGWDAARGCHVLDEDAVADGLEGPMAEGGVVLDHHSVDWLPLRWVQLVVVLRAHTGTRSGAGGVRGVCGGEGRGKEG